MRGFRSCKDPYLFQKVKEAVSMQQTVEFYGLQVDKKGHALCPFHRDTNPSLKIYPNGKGFYCFVCGAGGDPIKFAAMFRNISNTEAAKELAAAFGVPLAEPVSYREQREMELARRRRAERASFVKRARIYLTVYYGLLCEALRKRDRHFCEALERLSWTQYMLEQLEECPEQVYGDRKAVRRIEEIEGRIGGWYFEPEDDRALPGRDLLPDF